MKTSIFSKTTSGLPILAYSFLNQGPEVLILGGVHGDEPEGIACAQKLLEFFLNSYTYKLNITLVPQFNLEGIINNTRVNGRGVDLNRNLPTKDWSSEHKSPRYFPGPHPLSESENEGLIHYISEKKPKLIMSLHSWDPVLNINGNCLPEAEILASITGYRIDPDIGYPTPGSLGTYGGNEGRVPTLTYEIQRGLDFSSIQKIHAPAILESLKITERRF